MKKLVLTFLAVLLLLPGNTFAATIKTGENLFVDEKINDDLYASGGVLSIQEEVNGDLVAGGGKIHINSQVSEDLMALGGDVIVSGEVIDDVRMAGGSVRLNTTIKGDLMAAAGDISLSEDSFVGGDAYLAGGNLMLDGMINGDLKLAGGNIYLNTDVKGNLTLVNFEKITFGPNAKVQGSMWYRAAQELEIPSGMVAGGVIFSSIPTSQIEENLPAVLAGFSIFSLLSTLFFGLILIWLCRYYILHAAENAYETTLKSVGVGFLVLVLTPIVAVIFLITTIGAPLALTAFALWLIYLYMGKVVAAMLIGFKIMKVNDKTGFARMFGSFALGAVIYTLIGMVPMIGWVINLIFVLIALGAMALYELEVFYELRKKKIV